MLGFYPRDIWFQNLKYLIIHALPTCSTRNLQVHITMMGLSPRGADQPWNQKLCVKDASTEWWFPPKLMEMKMVFNLIPLRWEGTIKAAAKDLAKTAQCFMSVAFLSKFGVVQLLSNWVKVQGLERLDSKAGRGRAQARKGPVPVPAFSTFP